jgi:hypothetical protein
MAFVLDLKSTYEGEHTIFGFLSLANFAEDRDKLSLDSFAGSKSSHGGNSSLACLFFLIISLSQKPTSK